MPRRSEALLTSDWLSTALEFAKCFPTKLQDDFKVFQASETPSMPPAVAMRKVCKRIQDLIHQF